MTVLLSFPLLSPATLAAGGGIVLLYLLVSHLLRSAKLPPGPPTSWLGYTSIPAVHPWLYYEELWKEYGPVVGVRRGPFAPPMILVNTEAAAVELLDKRGATTSDRPRLYVAREVLCQGKGILLEGYGERWRRMRKAVHNQLMPKQARAYMPLSEAAARNVLRDDLKNPASFMLNFKKYAATLAMSMTYAKRTPTTYDDPELTLVHGFNQQLIAACRPVVESIPILKYWPGYLDEPKKAYESQIGLYRERRQKVLDEMKEDLAPPSFVKSVTENQADYKLDDDTISWVAGSLFSAGSDSTVGSLQTVLLLAAAYPEEQAKLQQEVDSVVGRDRLPTFDDMEHMPRTLAFVRETLRFRPIAPTGFAHRVMRDEQYEGYLIPEGAHIFGVIWNIQRDPAVYGHDADQFKPDRYLQKRADGTVELTQQTHCAYGHGRRICPGAHVANNSLFINLAMLIWAFELVPPSDENGKPVQLDVSPGAFQQVGFPYPKPFNLVFKKRSDNVEELLGGLEAENPVV